jgi:archaemetzincin
MVRRIHFLLGALVASTCLTGAYWFWPEGGGPLPAAAVAQISGPLYIVRVEPVTDASIRALVESLAPHLPIDVRFTDQWSLDERHTLQWDEDLYNSQTILEQLQEITPDGVRVMGITDQPMFDEGHWWLFGTAQLGGRTAILSTAHLWVDDIPGDTTHPIFRDRLSKVAVHEFGHTRSFIHCSDLRCVMNFSPDMTTLDKSRHTFCRRCLMQDFQAAGI